MHVYENADCVSCNNIHLRHREYQFSVGQILLSKWSLHMQRANMAASTYIYSTWEQVFPFFFVFCFFLGKSLRSHWHLYSAVCHSNAHFECVSRLQYHSFLMVPRSTNPMYMHCSTPQHDCSTQCCVLWFAVS